MTKLLIFKVGLKQMSSFQSHIYLKARLCSAQQFYPDFHSLKTTRSSCVWETKRSKTKFTTLYSSPFHLGIFFIMLLLEYVSKVKLETCENKYFQ